MKGAFTRSFLLAVALLACAELVVRVFFVRNMSGRFEYGYHPTSGFEENADGTLDLVRAGGRRFRPQSLKQKPDSGVLRVFVIGDSVPRGPSLERAYAAQMAELLKAQGVPAESYNLAVAGYGAERSHIVLKQALKYQPGLVVLHANTSNEFEDEREKRRKEEFEGWHPRNWPMKSLIVRRLYEAKTEKVFWEWLPVGVRNQGAVSDADAELTAGMNEEVVKRWGERVRHYVRESVELCRRQGVPVVVVAQAFRRTGPDGSYFMDGEQLMSIVNPLQGNGVEVVSMKDILAGQNLETTYADGSHVRADAHALIARAVVDRIIERSWARPGAARP